MVKRRSYRFLFFLFRKKGENLLKSHFWIKFGENRIKIKITKIKKIFCKIAHQFLPIDLRKDSGQGEKLDEIILSREESNFLKNKFSMKSSLNYFMNYSIYWNIFNVCCLNLQLYANFYIWNFPPRPFIQVSLH